ncbi:hypothetical protein KKG41_04305 [Patescibacteria group bacterium]|nr:hypothetical protein [Patescibacteria group bacterium]MBU1890715.1 hypothetical protein [Patescibacteria group bacterium]
MSVENTIFSRHTERADGSMGYSPEEADKISEQYPSLTKEGENRAREMANHEFGEMVDTMDENGIFFIGGSSEEERTKATADVIGDELSNKYKNKDETVVFTRQDIDTMRKQVKEKGSKILDNIRETIREHSDQKLVFTYPLFLKEFGLRPHHRDKQTGGHTAYMQEMLKQVENNEHKAVLEWFKNEGKISVGDEELTVPSPLETAETHLRGIERLKKFAEKFSEQRSITIGFVGHGWQLDALAVYLANNGEVSAEAFEKLFKSEEIKQPESGKIIVKGEKVSFIYRGNEYQIPEEILNKE